jgi:hypothetical protein
MDGSVAPRHMHSIAAVEFPSTRTKVKLSTQAAESACKPTIGYVDTVKSSGGTTRKGMTSKSTRARKYADVAYAPASRSRKNRTISSCQMGTEVRAMSERKSRMANSSPKRFCMPCTRGTRLFVHAA